MMVNLTAEEKSEMIPASHFRPRVARAIWHITFSGDIPFPSKIPSMDRDGTPRDEVIDNILYVTAGDAVRTYYFKEGYGPDFMRAELSSTQKKVNYNTASMRNAVASALKRRIEIFKEDPTKPPRDIVGFFLAQQMKSDSEATFAELFSMVSFTIFAGFAS